MTESQALNAIAAKISMSDKWMLSPRYLMCKTDYVVKGQQRFRRMLEYPLWVLLPSDGRNPDVLHLVPLRWLENAPVPVWSVPRRVFFNPQAASLVTDKGFVQVMESIGSTQRLIFLPKENFDVQAMKVFVKREYGITANSAAPHCFMDGERFFVGLLIKSINRYTSMPFVFDCYTRRLYTYCGWPVKPGGKILKGDFSRRKADEILEAYPKLNLTYDETLNAKRGTICRNGMLLCYDKGNHRIKVRIEKD